MNRNGKNRTEELAKLMETKLSMRGRGLLGKLNKAPRAMPRWVYRDAMRIAEAEQMKGHPKLAMRLQAGGLDRAYQRCEGWLQDVDPTQRRRRFWQGRIAANALSILLVGVGVLVTVQLAGLV
jgi:hypothetical protein